jgi:hypothetical protein
MALDRIWAHPTHALQRIFTHAISTARVASDQLPVVADIVPAGHTMTLGSMVAGPGVVGSGFPDPSEVEGSRAVVIS